jgi:hypothetical protein
MQRSGWNSSTRNVRDPTPVLYSRFVNDLNLVSAQEGGATYANQPHQVICFLCFLKVPGCCSRFERREAEAGEVTQSIPPRRHSRNHRERTVRTTHQPAYPAKLGGQDVTTVSRNCPRTLQCTAAGPRVRSAAEHRPRKPLPRPRLQNAPQEEREVEAGGARPSSLPVQEMRARPGPGPRIPSW